MKKFFGKKIAIISGGFSQEREVSLRSGKNVYNALKRLGYNVTLVDPAISFDLATFDVAFNMLHGFFGEDGAIQAIIEDYKIPVTGSSLSASLKTQNKIISKVFFDRHKIPTATFKICIQPLTTLPSEFSFPVFVKPHSEGSSVDVYIIHDNDDLFNKTTQLTNHYSTYLIETYIPGKEITVGIIQTPEIMALPILELQPKNTFYDYHAKYTPGMTTFVLPATLSDEDTVKVKEVAIQAFTLFGCSGFGRVDMIFHPERGAHVLEINTVPGMTDTSDLPAQAKEAGISFETLVEYILNTATLSTQKICV